MDADQARRLALNEAIARDVNMEVGRIAEQWHDAAEWVEFICECSRRECSERIHLPLTSYRATRENEHRFLLVDEHVNDEIERRVGAAGDATIVEKIGPGRDVAAATS